MREEVLEIAVSAALEAGALLCAELHRPGGPRGTHSHADVDIEVELIIRKRLWSAFPAWGYVGEETGAGTFPSGAPYWVVDPHDGTAWFLKGIRGSAVSVSLIRDGVPVLGVVYAFAVGDHGDLVTWAEGLPLRRNGRPVPPVEYVPECDNLLLLHSPAANYNRLANEAMSRPGKILTIPSVAYRLALVAAGDGHLALSLNSPTTWDIAGGHALLLGAGGDIWNEHGERIRYSPRGEMPEGRFVFGGQKEVVGQFRGRPWAEVLQ